MKKIYTFISIAAAALFALPSCEKVAEDSAFVTEYGAIVISDDMRTNPVSQALGAFVFVAGEDVVIPAKYEIKDGTLSESEIGFEWYFGAEVVSTTSSVNLGKMPAGRYYGMLVITDKRDGTKYSKEFNFQVNASAYVDGWAVLTDDGANSHVNYITIDPNTGEYIFVEDVLYGASGITLPTGMTDMEYHMYESDPYLFSVAFAGPGKESSIDVQFSNMEVLGNFAKEFVSPNDVEFTNIEVFSGFVAASTKDGDFFLRQENNSGGNDIPHTSFFPSRPVTIEGGLKVNHIASFSPVGHPWAGCSLSFAHDDLNGRALIMGNGAVEAINEDYYSEGIFENHRGDVGFDGVNYYEDITFPDPWNLADYNVLWMEGTGFAIDIFADFRIWSIVYFLEHKSSGARYIYAFDYNEDAWSGANDLNLDLFFPFPSQISIDPATMASCRMVGGNNNYVFFTANSNRDIYALNALSGTLKKVYSASSPVTGMVLGKIGDLMGIYGDPTLYDETIVIGEEDGTILVLEMNDAVISGAEPTVKAEFKSSTGKMTLGVFNPNNSTLS